MSAAPRSLTWALSLCLIGSRLAAAGAPEQGGPARPAMGVVVAEVVAESGGEAAGLRPGDRLLGWCRASPAPGPCVAAAPIASPFDLAQVDVEEIPQGGVELRGERDGHPASWQAPPRPLAVTVRPSLSAELARLYDAAESLGRQGGDPAAIAGAWRAVAAAAKTAGEPRLAVWLLAYGARTAAKAHAWPIADALYGEAAPAAVESGDPVAVVQVERAWGASYQERGLWPEALDHLARSLAADRQRGPDTLSAGWTLEVVAECTALKGDLRGAELPAGQALALRERLAPDSADLLATVNTLGIIAVNSGDLAAADRHFARVVALYEKLAPGSFELAIGLMNSGSLASRRGRLAAAEERFRRARAIFEAVRPDSVQLGMVLHNLGNLAARRADFPTAAEFLNRALALEEQRDPSSATVALTLESLALVEGPLGDWGKADERLRRALAINEKLAPDGPATASNLRSLGLAAANRKELEAADRYNRRALDLWQKIDPEGRDAALALRGLGTAAVDRGRLAEAEVHLRRALAIENELGPGTYDQAEALYNLGSLLLAQGHGREAADTLCRSIEALEAQRSGLGGTEQARSAFGVEYRSFYADCAAALAATGRPQEAFAVVEKGRARSFLERLAERDLALPSELPPDLARRQRELHDEYDEALAALARLGPKRDPAAVARLHSRLQDVRDSQQSVHEEIRRAAERFAALREPEPVGLAAARAALAPGTLLLSYSVGPQATHLFVVQPAGVRGSGLAAFALPIGEADLRARVAAFRDLLRHPESDRRRLEAEAARLYDLLLRPAETQLRWSERLLVSPEGPLSTLPFSALRRRGRYLVEWKPLHSVLSATVYAELAKRPRRPLDPERAVVAAYGDPAYRAPGADRDGAGAGALEVLEAVRRGLSLAPIPASRREVAAIAALFPRTRTFVGAQATEESVKAVGPGVRILHLATHGLLDEEFPLDSSLALTSPEGPAEGRDNGLLQAWEILESLRLDADLVTLSACDSALGKEMAGEGLIGLTRAFQYAGARSVLASLWSVSDNATAELMRRFYTALRAGRSKDAALREAQLGLVRSADPRLSHPYSWAAFELTGDWR
jgi:CHAT domain-containing protein/Tfp pilus assembly protein PilF